MLVQSSPLPAVSGGSDQAEQGEVAASGSARRTGGPVERFTGLSSSVKLILLLVFALAPFGLLAIFVSVQAAQNSQANRAQATQAMVAESARSLDLLLGRTEITLRTAGAALDRSGLATCNRTLAALAAEARPPVDYALFRRDGRLFCSTAPMLLPTTAVTLRPDLLTLAIPVAGGRLIGVARFSPAALRAAAQPVHDLAAPDRLSLRQGGTAMNLTARGAALPGDVMSAVAPVARGQLGLELIRSAERITAVTLLAILLPVLMVLAAGLVAFLVVDRLMLKPLARLQRAVSSYRAGDGALSVPRLTTPAHEVRDLADAFRGAAETIVRHEGELEQGLARQTKLTREVHHRVKNNLQVVASLLNLHARGAESSAVADAYAAIQRRVDALAVVHRNHYAELEENRGVALRPLIGELAANLRASAPAGAASMPILLDVAPLHVHQDIAVPVAFLITELVEAAMLGRPASAVAITLDPLGNGRARLTVMAEGLDDTADPRRAERMERVLTGLSRQLRAPLMRDAQGAVSIEIAVS